MLASDLCSTVFRACRRQVWWELRISAGRSLSLGMDGEASRKESDGQKATSATTKRRKKKEKMQHFRKIIKHRKYTTRHRKTNLEANKSIFKLESTTTMNNPNNKNPQKNKTPKGPNQQNKTTTTSSRSPPRSGWMASRS